jgi:hypothetical protein
MTTVFRWLIAATIVLLSGVALASALGLVAFTVLRVIGVDGSSWSAVGWMLIAFGASMIALLVLDHFDVSGDNDGSSE